MGRTLRIEPGAVAGRAVVALALFLAAPPGALEAQERLTVDRIYATDDFSTRGIRDLTWIDAGERFAFVRTREESGVAEIWTHDVAEGREILLVAAADLVPPGRTEPLDIDGFRFSPAGERILLLTNAESIWRRSSRGIYWVYERTSGELTPLSDGVGWQQYAKFSPDGAKVAFVRDHDLFVVDLASGRERALTTDGSDVVINGTVDWVYEEELSLSDGWRWSPDGTRIAFWRFDQSTVKEFPMMDMLPVYPEIDRIRYPKAGESNSRVRVGVVDVASGETAWMEPEGTPEGAYIARMDWAPGGDSLVIQRLNRHQNRIDVLLADASGGGVRTLLSESDDAWVDVDDDLTWVDDGARFLWTSEADGWDHVYLHDRSGRVVRRLTEGSWEVRGIEGVDDSGERVYFEASRPTPLQRHLYRVSLEGGEPERLSEAGGSHSMRLAPGGGHYVDVRSAVDTPPVTTLHRAAGDEVRILAENGDVARRLEATGVRSPEFFTFTTSGGTELNGWMIRPPDFDRSREYPVLLYVYGGPGSQTVTDAWGGSRYLWHQLLASRGYIVASVDNRGTGARGRDFEKQTYLRLGIRESDDQMEAARHLASLEYVDGSRIGIWGWSYGGYMTALTTMRGGDLFRAGISVAPVTHWKFYDTIYTERYMRTPLENPEGYRVSAPLGHVEGLTADFLVVHGTGDDNVHPQNTVHLLDRLQAAGKEFSLMLYPNKAHGIGGSSDRVHLFDLLTRWVEGHL